MDGYEPLPEWDLTEVFEDFGSESYERSKRRIASLGEEALEFFEASAAPRSDEDTTAWLRQALRLLEDMGKTLETLSSYAYARYSTDTRESRALAEINAIEELALAPKRAKVAFRNALAARGAKVRVALRASPEFRDYAYLLEQELMFQSHQMSPELEDLAEDLGRSGADAWSRLQESISSTASALWDEKSGERKTLVELRNLAYDPDRSVREKAFKLELEQWKAHETPIAAALNGVKGNTISLAKRRKWSEALETSIAQARIERKTLDALIASMEASLPMWRRYLSAKAAALGVDGLAFFDLFAPVSDTSEPIPDFSWSDAQGFIVEKFSSFDPGMGEFAARAFDRRWIDAKPRAGKVGGAYCIDFPLASAARVFCNFDGSFSSVTTVAHELGHAWHHECIKDRPHLLSQYPMTLAETASIFAETVVSEATLSSASLSERLRVVEMQLQDGCQVIVDILSRFYFEKALFEGRDGGELDPERLCSLMLDAQARTYGDGLLDDKRHPYMWAVKGHYYIPSLSFYNFPYAFGLLFGLGLYERYRAEGSSFAADYRRLLSRTGESSAEEVARLAGFNIQNVDFWNTALSTFERKTSEFEALVKARA